MRSSWIGESCSDQSHASELLAQEALACGRERLHPPEAGMKSSCRCEHLAISFSNHRGRNPVAFAASKMYPAQWRGQQPQ